MSIIPSGLKLEPIEIPKQKIVSSDTLSDKETFGSSMKINIFFEKKVIWSDSRLALNEFISDIFMRTRW